jgi:hypothetical protein
LHIGKPTNRKKNKLAFSFEVFRQFCKALWKHCVEIASSLKLQHVWVLGTEQHRSLSLISAKAFRISIDATSWILNCIFLVRHRNLHARTFCLFLPSNRFRSKLICTSHDQSRLDCFPTSSQTLEWLSVSFVMQIDCE